MEKGCGPLTMEKGYGPLAMEKGCDLLTMEKGCGLLTMDKGCGPLAMEKGYGAFFPLLLSCSSPSHSHFSASFGYSRIRTEIRRKEKSLT